MPTCTPGSQWNAPPGLPGWRIEPARRAGGRAIGRALVVAVLPWLAAGCGGASSTPFKSAWAFGEERSTAGIEAQAADRGLLGRLTFEPIVYQRPGNLDALPSLTEVCGVKYVLSADRWGVVPDLTYACGDEAAKQKALKDAPQRLRRILAVPASDYEPRLRATAAPATSLRAFGGAFVSAHGLGVGFDPAACLDTVADRLARSLRESSTLQCETFLAPGAALEDFRERLTAAAERAESLTQVPLGLPGTAIAPETAARCQAEPGTPIGVPAAISSQLRAESTAYALRVPPGLTVEITLTSSAFDAMLRLYDADCRSVLASDDDGGGGLNSRIRWSASGDYVVVATSVGGGRGAYVLSLAGGAPVRVLSDQERASARAFAEWVRSASDDAVAAAWRASQQDVQLACLHRERYRSNAAARAAVLEDASTTCLEGLKQATEARKLVLAAGTR